MDSDEFYEASQKKKMSTIKGKVAGILNSYEGRYGKNASATIDPRNNDSYLIILYLKKYEPDVLRSQCPKCNHVYKIWIDWKTVERISGLFESIRRARQKLNEAELYLPSDPEVLKKRKRKERATKKIMPEL